MNMFRIFISIKAFRKWLCYNSNNFGNYYFPMGSSEAYDIFVGATDAVLSIGDEAVNFERASSEAVDFCKGAVDRIKLIFNPINVVADDDDAKLMKQMKTSMGMQVDIGLESSKSFGLLVEGWRCKLYSMELVEDGVYLPAMIKRF
ncbi:hypothetical protein CU097_011815 [Rhizopus azygosporus]|uniref:Uncharacterized protein n=1 Tax=Rhizopus azygosporus TaxID=86630 RepID=A0A367KA65_RHIAZ|nr:hypothetical protein CU097_011815 [Rhizopus azygosporus]